jgi:hypothetical protein
MYKVFHFVKRKPHLTHEQFREHFERSHAAMAIRYFGHLFTEYRRHYGDICWSGGDPRKADGSFAPHECKWDLMSEWTTASKADFDEIQGHMEDPEYKHLFLDDEDRFIERTALMMMPCTASHNTGTVFDPRNTVFDTPSGEPSWEGHETWQPLDR